MGTSKLKILGQLLQLQGYEILPQSLKKHIQKIKLKQQLKRVRVEFDYFRNQSAKLNPNDLQSFPLLNKSKWLENFSGLNSKGFSYKYLYDAAKHQETNRDFSNTLEGYTIGLSSGTSGNPGIILASEKDRAIWVATVFKKVIGFEWRKRKVAFFLRANSSLYQSVNSTFLEFRYFDLSRPMEELLSELKTYQASIIVAPATVLEFIALNLHFESNEKPEQLISVAEVLDSSTKIILSEIFPQTRISEVYQATEGLLGYSCEKGKIHLNEDQVHFECIPFPDKVQTDQNKSSRIVQIVITDFTRQTMPMIRYKMEDLLELDENPCSCGNKNSAVTRIIGRNEDCLRFKNKDDKLIWLFPDLLRQWIIRADAAIKNFKITQTGAYSLELELLIQNTVDEKNLKEAALLSIQDLLNQFAKENNIQQKITLELIEYKASTDWTTKFRRVIYKPRT